MLQMGDEFSATDKTALLKCLFGFKNELRRPWSIERAENIGG